MLCITDAETLSQTMTEGKAFLLIVSRKSEAKDIILRISLEGMGKKDKMNIETDNTLIEASLSFKYKP